jgi:hypothetical protein
MKPKNNTEVRKAYLRFAGYLTCCIILAVTIFACFLKTSGIEVKRITEQALEYDHIYAKELSLSNSVDSVYQYMKLMNTSPPDQRHAPTKRCQYTQDEPAQICPGHGCQGLQALQATFGKHQHLPRSKGLHPSAEYPGRDGEERPDAMYSG